MPLALRDIASTTSSRDRPTPTPPTPTPPPPAPRRIRCGPPMSSSHPRPPLALALTSNLHPRPGLLAATSPRVYRRAREQSHRRRRRLVRPRARRRRLCCVLDACTAFPARASRRAKEHMWAQQRVLGWQIGDTTNEVSTRCFVQLYDLSTWIHTRCNSTHDKCDGAVYGRSRRGSPPNRNAESPIILY